MGAYKYDPHKKLKDEKEKAEWRKKAYETFQQELLNNEEFLKYTDGFQGGKDKVEDFVRRYAQLKTQWLEWGPRYTEWQENEDLNWVNDAFERLKEIQQKKLFDLQCHWRAEQIEIAEIECAEEFLFWEHHVLNCPFLEPVEMEEVELYQQYLSSNNFEFEQGWLDRWQDYNQIKLAEKTGNANRNFPDWYDFHNGRTGKGIYLTLPDIRGEKEEFYLSIWREDFHKEADKKKLEREQDPTFDKRPSLSYHKNGFIKWFVRCSLVK